MLRLVSAMLVFLPLGSALAGLGPIPGEERFQGVMAQQGGDKQSLGADLGFGAIAEDFFLQLTLRTELNLGPVGLGLQVPLNLRVYDKAPKNNNDFYGLIRHEDWDEASEFAKVIRFIRLGHKRDAFYLRAGELTADLGHGTIMDRYVNNLDINTWRAGVAFDVNTSYGGVETVISDIGTLYDTKSPDSRILGGRAYWKPMALLDPDSIFNIFSLGVTVVSDTNAPNTYKTHLDPKTNTQVPNIKDDNFEVATTTAATVFGFDAEAEVMHNALLDLIPYTDLNFLQQAGWGWHTGILLTAKMPIGIDLSIPVRLEYRRFKSDYVPQYFGPFYEVERYSDPASEGIEPKARTVRGIDNAQGLNGYYGDLAFDFAGIFQFGAVYENYERQGLSNAANIQAFLSVPALETFQFKAYYARTGIEGWNDTLVLKDKKSMGVVQARYQLVSALYLVGRVTQRWKIAEKHPEKGYVPAFEWKFGFEGALDF